MLIYICGEENRFGLYQVHMSFFFFSTLLYGLAITVIVQI